MYDRFNRKINYLRISVTDKCNLRCYYCMPPEGIKLLRHEDILSFEEIVEIVSYGVSQGIDKVRLTGGEPLVRRGIVKLVRMLSDIGGIKDLSMTTNGILLEDYAKALAQAGLDRINVSLDTLDPNKYSKITRGESLYEALMGLKSAKDEGLWPIKINTVINRYFNDEDRTRLSEYCSQNGFELRFIREMNLSRGIFSPVEGGSGGNCKTCNRLRLTSSGILKPCLFSDIGFDLRKMGKEEAFKLALINKPGSGSTNISCTFYNMGG